MIGKLFRLSNIPISLCEIQIWGYNHTVKNLCKQVILTKFLIVKKSIFCKFSKYYSCLLKCV